MGIEQFLTAEDKIASLEKLTKLLSLDIYTLCLRAGIDPDGFDYLSYEAPNGGLNVPYLKDLENRSKSLAAAEAKLEELRNA
jgi:hypothetical protein